LSVCILWLGLLLTFYGFGVVNHDYRLI
jgi:hypothetical protein